MQLQHQEEDAILQEGSVVQLRQEGGVIVQQLADGSIVQLQQQGDNKFIKLQDGSIVTLQPQQEGDSIVKLLDHQEAGVVQVSF